MSSRWPIPVGGFTSTEFNHLTNAHDNQLRWSLKCICRILIVIMLINVVKSWVEMTSLTVYSKLFDQHVFSIADLRSWFFVNPVDALVPLLSITSDSPFFYWYTMPITLILSKLDSKLEANQSPLTHKSTQDNTFEPNWWSLFRWSLFAHIRMEPRSTEFAISITIYG